jgi:diketogulonate reductase-like aldo/keto reductase
MTDTPESRSRRLFIGSLAATFASTWLSPVPLFSAEQKAIRKMIPATGETLPVIGMGTSRTFNISPRDPALANLGAVLESFFANGGALIDSSPMYGAAEEVIGALLVDRHAEQQLFAATKVWTDGAQAGIRQMEDSAQKWGIERFDLMQIHNLRDWQTHLKTLREWQAQGKVRYIGITTSHGRFHGELENILRNEPLDFIQFSYNIENRTAEQRLLPIAAERGIAVLINRPYQRGSLFGKVRGQTLPDWTKEFDCHSWGQFFLKFIASHPAVTCVIPATSKVHHMRDNMAAGFGRLPDPATRQRMIAFFEAL